MRDRPRLNNLCFALIKAEFFAYLIICAKYLLSAADKFSVEIKVRSVKQQNIGFFGLYFNLGRKLGFFAS